ncbi:SC65 protein, partial [Indicator maculatus]|nr:SC65 protein [Indicator maculatus]
SLRLHRLLRDSEAHCHRRCSPSAEGGGDPAEEGGDPAEAEPAVWEWQRELQLFGRLLRRAGCLRACKRDLPVFQLRYPPAQTLRDFQRRLPYQYLHYALFKSNKIEKAVSAAHTFLQKNPKHEMTLKYLNYYRTMLDVDEYLVDLEAPPYEVRRELGWVGEGLPGALCMPGPAKPPEGSSSASPPAPRKHLCGAHAGARVTSEGVGQAGCCWWAELGRGACWGAGQLPCGAQGQWAAPCGARGEKFVATMYHYLQFAYYKLNDVRDAVRAVSSYMLFDPADAVMQQNLVYYRFHRQRWRLQGEDFQPRPEAVRYHTRTAAQKKMLEFARQYLQTDDDEMEVGEEGLEAQDLPSDSEFEGEGDYEEDFFAEWWQEPKTKGDKADQ